MSSPWDQWIKRNGEEDELASVPLTSVTAMLAQFMPKGSGLKPALPADYRPREISSYSPALKRTGGYSYSPSQSSASPLKKHIYDPEVECREDIGPPKQPDKPKGNYNGVCSYRGTNYIIKNGNVFTADGRSVLNNIKTEVLTHCNQQNSK